MFEFMLLRNPVAPPLRFAPKHPAAAACLLARRWNIVFGFHVPQYPQGHQATDYWRWIKSRGAYPVQYQVRRWRYHRQHQAADPAPGSLRGRRNKLGRRLSVVFFLWAWGGRQACRASAAAPLTSAGSSVISAAVPQIGYEPYIMMHRAYIPFYDERFRGYYW